MTERLSYVVVNSVKIVCQVELTQDGLCNNQANYGIDQFDLNFLLVFTIFETNALLQFLSSSTQTSG